MVREKRNQNAECNKCRMQRIPASHAISIEGAYSGIAETYLEHSPPLHLQQ
jgi:hypothetical protein